MQAVIKKVNENGLKEIHSFLAEKHKKGAGHFDSDMLRAYASEAEFQIGEGNPASIELKSWETISGHTENFTISDSGLDSEIIEIEE